MKKSLILSVVCLLAAVLTTTTASAQENGKWVQNCKEFPRSIVTKVRLKDNGGTAIVNDIVLDGEDGKTVRINAKKLTVNKYKFKDMAEDTDGWRVCILPSPSLYDWKKNSNCSDICYNNVQFYVDTAATAIEQSWQDSNENFPKDVQFTKIRIKRFPFHSDEDIDCSAFLYDNKGNKISMGNRFYSDTKLNSPYIEGQYPLNVEKIALKKEAGEWVIYTFKNPVTFDTSREIVFKNVDDNVQFFVDADNSKFSWISVTSDKNNTITVDGKSMVYTKYEAITPSQAMGNVEYPVDYSLLNIEGYLSDNKLYEKATDGSVKVIRQIVNGIPCPVSDVDVINEAEISKKDLILKYENGDNLTIYIGDDWNLKRKILSGTIHRQNGIFTYGKSGNNDITVEYPNGDSFTGSFDSHRGGEWQDLTSSVLDYGKYYNGTLFTKDGQKINYKNGRSEAEIDAENKAKAAEEEKIYRQACAKWGKKYVDAALTGNIIVGMPEDLLVAVFSCQLSHESQHSRCYHIMGIGSVDYGYKTVIKDMVKKVVWVSNGRVTSISNL